MRITVFRVEGMHCEGCAQAVKNALTSLHGVERVIVMLGEGKVIVAYDPERIRVKRMVEAIEAIGYRVKR